MMTNEEIWKILLEYERNEALKLMGFLTPGTRPYKRLQAIADTYEEIEWDLFGMPQDTTSEEAHNET